MSVTTKGEQAGSLFAGCEVVQIVAFLGQTRCAILGTLKDDWRRRIWRSSPTLIPGRCTGRFGTSAGVRTLADPEEDQERSGKGGERR